MVLHRKQAQFDRAKWRMSVLLPCWALQVVLMIVLMSIFSYRLAHTVEKYDEDEKNGKAPAVEFVWEITGIIFPLLSLCFTIFEIAKSVAETLTPWSMLFTHVMKLTITTASLSIDIVWVLEQEDRHYSIVGLVLDIVLLLIILIPAVYSIRTYRRLAAYDDYHHPANVKSFGYHDLEQQQKQQRHSLQPEIRSRLSVGTISSLGAASLRRFSASSANTPAIAGATVERKPDDPSQQLQMQQQSGSQLPAPGKLARTPSYYNNERDTQFEKYMVERAMASEFSNGGFAVSRTSSTVGGNVGPGAWIASNRSRRSSSFGSTPHERGHGNGTNVSPNRSASNATDVSSVSAGSASPSTLSANTITGPGSSPGGVVVGAGNMNNSKALRDSMNRAPSWGSQHVLVAVPEEGADEGDEYEQNGRRGSGGKNSDRQALLGDDEENDRDRRERFRDEAMAALEFEELDLSDAGERKRKRSV